MYSTLVKQMYDEIEFRFDIYYYVMDTTPSDRLHLNNILFKKCACNLRIRH